MRLGEHWARQLEARRIALLRLVLDQWSARVAEAEKLRGLVERLADRVVYGSAQPFVLADAAHRDDLGVAAGREKQAVREGHAVREAGGERMCLEMIDRDQRLWVDQSEE